MKKRASTTEATIRAAVIASDDSNYKIAKAAKMAGSQLSRFIAGTSLTNRSLENLAAAVGLEIVVQPQRKNKGS